MARTIDSRIDALFVEGPDDGATVNAIVKRYLAVDLAALRLVKTKEEGGGYAWALDQFAAYATERTHARVGVIVDRDTPDRDKWPAVRDRLRRLGAAGLDPTSEGVIVQGRLGAWMWPNNVAYGSLEDFVEPMFAPSPVLAHAREASRTAKEHLGAEYDLADAEKATLKVRSIWADARAAGGYGHLVRNLPVHETPGLAAFLAWFKTLFLT